MQIAKDGRRIIWLGARERAEELHRASTSPIRASRKWWCRPTCRTPYMRSNSLEVVGDIMAVAYQTQKVGQKPAGLRAVRHVGAGEAEVDLVLRLLGRELARRAPAVVLRRRIRPHGVRRAGLPAAATRTTTSSIASSTCAIRRSRSRSAAGGCRARERATRSRRPRATRVRQRLPRAQHQRLPAAAGPLLSRLHRRRHVRAGHHRQVEAEADLALGQLAALYTASPTRCCRCSSAIC